MRKAFTPYLLILTLLAFLQGCTGSSPLKRLRAIDSLVNARPDSALTLLNTLLPDTNQMSKRTLMRFHLLRTNAQNKCDTVLTARHAALMRRVCDYYDHTSPSWGDKRGAANNRMLAHYLLGRCYSDMGEAPKALESYSKATDFCDSINDCDYSLLSIVYYQKARLLLYQQVLPDAIACYEKARKTAFLSGDSLWATVYLEHKASAYYMMHQYDSVLSICNQASEEYIRQGYVAESYNSFPLIADVLLERGQTDSVGRLLTQYESKSGLFDDNGDIQHGREIYYGFKGKYLMEMGKYEQARDYFVKLLNVNNDPNQFEAATKGLFELYSKLHLADSISKYAKMYCSANDSSYNRIYTAEMVKAKSMYDYGRVERLANEKTFEIAKTRNKLYSLSAILIVIVCLVIIIVISIRKRDREQKLRIALLNTSYNSLLSQYKGVQSEHHSFERNSQIQQLALEKSIAQMKERLKGLQSQNRLGEKEYNELADKYRISQWELQQTKKKHEKSVESFQKRIDDLSMQLSEFTDSDNSRQEKWNAEDALLHFRIVEHLHQLSSVGRMAVENQWRELESIVAKNLSSFYQTISSESIGLNETEKRTAMLIRLQFIVSECCVLLDKKNQNMTNIRSNINRKLFNCTGTKGLKAKIMDL